jgi:hypothetical protein
MYTYVRNEYECEYHMPPKYCLQIRFPHEFIHTYNERIKQPTYRYSGGDGRGYIKGNDDQGRRREDRDPYRDSVRLSG